MQLISKTTTSLIFVALTCFITATAHAITYNVNRTVGANGFIFGTIDTDDTIGPVTLTSNIISWNLDLTINSTTVNMSSAAGGGLLQSGVSLEATPTELRWVLGSVASSGGAAICQIGCGLGNTQWRLLGNGFEVIENISGELNQSITHPLNSTIVLGTAAVPVPAALWLMISGMLGLLGLSRRK